VGSGHEAREDLSHRRDKVVNRLVVAVIAAAGVLGSSIMGFFAGSGPQIWGLHFLSVIGFSVSAMLGFWLVWGVIRSGRL